MVVLAMLLPAGRAAGAETAAAPTFARATTIVGEGIVRTQLLLPSPVTFTRPSSAAETTALVSFEGGGAGLAGLFISPDDKNEWSFVVRMPEPANTTFGPLKSFTTGCAELTCTLQPGLYNVVLLGQGNVAATIRLSGLPGAALTVPATTPVDGRIFNAATHTFDPGTDALQGGDAAVGAGWIDDQRGELNFSLSGFWFDGAQESPTGVDDAIVNVGAMTACTYTEPDFATTRPFIDPVAFGPGCPGAGNSVPTATVLTGFKTHGMRWQAVSPTARGPYGAGGWTAHTGADNPAAAGFWFDQRWHLRSYQLGE
jgi:hypothetical protein